MGLLIVFAYLLNIFLFFNNCCYICEKKSEYE